VLLCLSLREAWVLVKMEFSNDEIHVPLEGMAGWFNKSWMMRMQARQRREKRADEGKKAAQASSRV